MAEQTITIPDNMELVKISDTEYKIVEKKGLPKSWTEFCKTRPLMKKECYINDTAQIVQIHDSLSGCERSKYWSSLLPNKEYAEAILALCQLIQLRDCYRQGWEPDWKDGNHKGCVLFNNNVISAENVVGWNEILCFQSKELAEEFLENFKDLIEKTKPLFM